MREEGLDEESARLRLQTADATRRAYLRRLFGREPEDPGLYQLHIDSTAITPAASAEMVVDALRGLRPASAREAEMAPASTPT